MGIVVMGAFAVALVAAGSSPPPAKPASAALASPPTTTAKSARDLLQAMKDAYGALEYEAVLPLAEQVLARSDELTLDEKLDAYLFQARALAIVGDPLEAEKPFRLLLLGRPDYELPPETPPKILAVFRKVQVEEGAVRRLESELKRKRILDGLQLVGTHPTAAVGGKAIRFAYRLKDDDRAVEGVRVLYRKVGDTDDSALALKRGADDVWTGRITGEWTASDTGFTLAFRIETFDRAGPLLQVGSSDAPLTAAVSAGRFERSSPPPLPVWSFVTAAGVTTAIAATAVGTGVGTMRVQDEYRSTAAAGTAKAPASGAALMDLQATGDSLALATNVLWVGAGVGALAAGVMMPFVNWSGETQAVDE